MRAIDGNVVEWIVDDGCLAVTDEVLSVVAVSHSNGLAAFTKQWVKYWPN